MKKIRVLVVEDSLTVRMRLIAALAADAECEVVGEASDGNTAIAMCEALRPDVVTLDMVLGGENGLGVTEQVMGYFPTPIVIVSETIHDGELPEKLDALAAGAVDLIEKPSDAKIGGDWDKQFISKVKLAARIKVITHLRARLRGSHQFEALLPPVAVPSKQRQYELIAMGASTGGPSAVVAILERRRIPLPILLVIHTAQPTSVALSDWLNSVLPVPVTQARDGEPLPRPGEPRVIIAPADRHMIVHGGRVRLTQDPERHGCRPAIDLLFESVAQQTGAGAIGCLLTGMGRDGADGLLAMKRQGAMTVAQDESTSVVYGMPREAIRMGAANRIVPLGHIGPLLTVLAKQPEQPS